MSMTAARRLFEAAQERHRQQSKTRPRRASAVSAAQQAVRDGKEQHASAQSWDQDIHTRAKNGDSRPKQIRAPHRQARTVSRYDPSASAKNGIAGNM